MRTLLLTPGLLLTLGLLLTACGDRAPAPPTSPTPGAPAEAAWNEVAADGLAPAQQAQAAKAAAARDALATRLQGRLAEEVATHGAAASIGTCRDIAPQLAREIAAEHGVRIGRTSHKLRSLMNGPPAWAEALVATRRETQALLAAPDGRLGAFYPVRTQPLCLSCHGARDTLAADVRAALERDYPSDRATGFAQGDVRGWLWVEVPAR